MGPFVRFLFMETGVLVKGGNDFKSHICDYFFFFLISLCDNFFYEKVILL